MYNANPNYEMDFMILKDVNEHMEGLFQRFSKLLPFRIDFAYRKDTPSFGHGCKHSMCMEIYRLLSETQSMLAGYYWVGNDSNLLIVFYVQIMPDDFVMQLHRF